jgi:integrase
MDRWPLLEGEAAAYWLDRWCRGISPYSRVRSHTIRLQLEAIIALALDCGLRRNEILALTEDWMHYDNLGVVVWQPPGPWQGLHREVPYTARTRKAIWAWIEFRTLIGPEHDSPWLNLWAEETIRRPLRPDAFHRLLRIYIGREWSYRRLRDSCAVSWLNAGLPLEHVRRLLGLSSLEATLPYARLARGSLERRMARVEERFAEEIAA